MGVPKDKADLWEKAFRTVMTVLWTIVMAASAQILKSNSEMQVELATIRVRMLTRNDLEMLNEKLSTYDKRILTVELSCRRGNRL